MVELAESKVIITGAAGFLGRHLYSTLQSRGVAVIGCDNNWGTADLPLPGESSEGRLVQCDITRPETLDFLKEGDVVFHLAAIANPRTCADNFDLAFRVNVEGTKNVLDAYPEGSRVIFLSAAMAYGEPLYLPLDENHPLRAEDPYSTTKIVGERLCRAYAHMKGLRLTIVRNFSTYGPGQSVDYIVPRLLSQALAEGKIEIWTSTPTRDFTYVDDTIEALIAIAQSEELVGETVNVGSGQEVSIGVLAEKVSRLFGRLPVVDLKKEGVGGGRQVCNSDKLRQRSGWQPKVSLEEGLRRTIYYLRERSGNEYGRGHKTAD